MMLKKIGIFGLTALALLTLTACNSATNNQNAVQSNTSQQSSSGQSQSTGQGSVYSPAISQEDAVKAALNAAGLTQEQVTNLIVEQDFDDMPYHYEIEFVKDMTEYSYSIDADSGNILEQSQEHVND